MESVIAACIYSACRSYNIPRTLDEMATASDVERKEIGRTYRFIIRKLGILLASSKGLMIFKHLFKRLNSRLNNQNQHRYGPTPGSVSPKIAGQMIWMKKKSTAIGKKLSTP